MGFFLFMLQRERKPLSEPVMKVSSSIMDMRSMLPSVNLRLAVVLVVLSSLLLLTALPLPPPRNTSCVSSATFHNRAVRSRAPTLTHRSCARAAMSTTSSWCPKSVST